MIIQDKKPQFSVFLILFFAAVISRIYGIWEWDLVDDEYFTATKAAERYLSIINPAYYSLVVLTNGLLGPDAWLSRLPAFILSIVSIPVLYLLWSRIFGKNAALFAAVILIFSAWHLWFSQYARFYIGVFLFSSGAYYFFLRAVYTEKLLSLIWALVFSLIAILFHVTAVFVPVSVALAYLLIWIMQKDNSNIHLRNIKIYLIICVVAGILLLSVLLNVLDRWVSTSQTWGYGSVLILPQLIKYIQVPIVVSAFFGWLILLKTDKVAAIFFFAGLLVPAVFLITASPFMAISPSYAFYILPLVVILAGILCEEVREKMSNHYSSIISTAILFLLLSSLLPSFASHYLARKSLNFNSAVSFVNDNYRQGDQVLSFIPGFELPGNKGEVLLPFINFERDTYTDWTNELQPILGTDSRTWIIVSSKRKPLASKLEQWLFCHSKLVWQKHATRLDYEVDGYQIYLVSDGSKSSEGFSTCSDK